LFSLHKISVSGLFIFLFSSASGSDPYFLPAGAAEAGMSFSCITQQGFWSSFHNQALLPLNSSATFGFNYHDRFNISELGTRSAGFVIPVRNAGIGAVYSHFGYKDFTRHSGGIGCGMKLSESITAGIQIDYFGERTPGEYNERHSLTFEAGLLLSVSEKVKIGIHLFNPVPGSLRKSFLPSSLSAGAGIRLNSQIYASAEAEISTGSNPAIKTGFEYEPGKNLKLRGGFTSEYNSFSFGAGYTLSFVQLDIAFATHEKLGVTSSVSMIFRIHTK
jgi:hypothetical protein